MTSFLIYSHIVAGSLALILGISNIFNHKGGASHRLLGKVYVGTMWWICLSALLLITFHRFSFFLMVIAVLTFYATFIGIRVLNRKRIGSEKWYDWVASILTALFGIGLIAYGVYLFVVLKTFHFLGMLSLIFGVFTLLSALGDIRFFYSGSSDDRMWWLYQHINAMGGSFIAAVTAVAVQNGAIFLQGSDLAWLLWILPSLVGAPLIGITIRRYKRKHQQSAVM